LKPGNILIRDGEIPGALFLIASGTAGLDGRFSFQSFDGKVSASLTQKNRPIFSGVSHCHDQNAFIDASS
jgi:hypothetical protein